MQNNGNKISLDIDRYKYFVYYDKSRIGYFIIGDNLDMKNEGSIYFYDYETAQRAILEIIEPFMKEHPEFVW